MSAKEHTILSQCPESSHTQNTIRPGHFLQVEESVETCAKFLWRNCQRVLIIASRKYVLRDDSVREESNCSGVAVTAGWQRYASSCARADSQGG
jgi:hypothetical protein